MLLCCFPQIFCTWNSLSFLDLWNYSFHQTGNISAIISSNLFFSSASCPEVFFFFLIPVTHVIVHSKLSSSSLMIHSLFSQSSHTVSQFYCCIFESTNLFFWSTSSVFNPNKHVSCQTLCFSYLEVQFIFCIIHVSLFNMFIISTFVLEYRTVTVTV